MAAVVETQHHQAAPLAIAVGSCNKELPVVAQSHAFRLRIHAHHAEGKAFFRKCGIKCAIRQIPAQHHGPAAAALRRTGDDNAAVRLRGHISDLVMTAAHRADRHPIFAETLIKAAVAVVAD